MPSNFRDHGRALLANGYLIIPIQPATKRPALADWPHARLGVADLLRYPHHGVGVLCGQGAQPVVALDVDTINGDLAARFVAWCQEHLGATCERVGRAPRILLVYRAESEGWAKAASAWFAGSDGERHRLEILGNGQQFVAYHIHPETHEPYEWVDLFGGLDSMRARDLPAITEARVEEALRVFESMAAEAGLARVADSRHSAGGMISTPPDDDPLMAYEPPVGIDMSEARRLMSYVDAEDYDTWLKVGMALHHEFSGAVAALDAWDRWSSTGGNYVGRVDLETRWKSFGQSGRTPITARWLLMVGHQGERGAARAEKHTALASAKGLILACEDSIDLMGDVAQRAGEAAGTDLALRAELTGLIRARFRTLTNTNMLVSEVRAAMAGGRKATAPTGTQRRPLTEFGNSERMLDRYGEDLMYVPETEQWYAWTGIYWHRTAGVEMEHRAKETVWALPNERRGGDSDGEQATFARFCTDSQRALMVRNMVRLAQSDPRVVVGVQDLDRRSTLLGASNGVVDLRSGKLLASDRAYRITTTTEVDYCPEAKCPLFESTLSDVFFGDADMISFLQRLAGYSLMGQPSESVLIIPYGLGCNGKSTVMGAIRHALGGYAMMANADTFTSSGAGAAGTAGAAREDVLRLRGARYVYVGEPDEGSVLREGLVKTMTGGESLPARGLYSRTTVEVAPTWVAVMPTNHLPTIRGDDYAIWRRLMPVPFTRDFDHDVTVQKDGDRKEKLLAEAQGILAWCVRGALAYQREGLRPPECVRQAREDYRSGMDLLGEWLSECCDVGPDYVDTNARLWASWEAFANARGELRLVPSSRILARRLDARGLHKVKDTKGIIGRGRSGVRVRQVDFC